MKRVLLLGIILTAFGCASVKSGHTTYPTSLDIAGKSRESVYETIVKVLPLNGYPVKYSSKDAMTIELEEVKGLSLPRGLLGRQYPTKERMTIHIRDYPGGVTASVQNDVQSWVETFTGYDESGWAGIDSSTIHENKILTTIEEAVKTNK